MTFVGSFQIDPKDYPFQKFIDEQKELDTDELRHTIKAVIHVIDRDFKGEEHLYCHKDQLCPLGKYRRPKHIIEAEQRGFSSGLEMAEVDKKAKENAKDKEIDDLKKQLAKIATVLQALGSSK
jgi:hypothetical protein